MSDTLIAMTDVAKSLGPTAPPSRASNPRATDSVTPQTREPKQVSVEPLHVEKLSPEEIVQEVEAAVKLLNDTVARENVRLNFRMDEILNKPIVTVVSEETGEVIHQLPNEKILHAARQIQTMKGVLFDQRT